MNSNVLTMNYNITRIGTDIKDHQVCKSANYIFGNHYVISLTPF